MLEISEGGWLAAREGGPVGPAFDLRTEGPETPQLLRLEAPLTLDAVYLWLDGLLLELLRFDRPTSPPAHGRHQLGVALFVEDPDGQAIEVIGPNGQFRALRDRSVRKLSG